MNKNSHINFFAPGLPKGQPRPRAFARRMGEKWVARVYDDGTAEGWKSQIASAAKDHRPESPMEGPVALSVTFFLSRTKSHFRSNGELKPGLSDKHTVKPDADNLMKAVKDCLTQLGFWRDDAQVCTEECRKRYTSGGKTGASIEIYGVE